MGRYGHSQAPQEGPGADGVYDDLDLSGTQGVLQARLDGLAETLADMRVWLD